jgi:fused signal recognition particle receptor
LSRDFAAQQNSWRTTILPAEIQKAKELWLQAERVARESFLSHRAKQIKAETLASLEPEVQRALARERAERKENEELLARRHAQALQDQRHDHESLIASIRKQHLTALEHAREEERVAAQRRAREIVERYDAQMQDMRSRHTAELEAERDRATKTSSSLQHAIDAATMQARQDALVSAAKAAEAARQEQDDLVRRHALALAQEREKQSIERESWQSLMLAKLSREAESRLAAAKKETDRAHEEEISMLVARLGADAEKQVKDVVRDSERKIDALKRATQADIANSKTKADEASKHLATLKKEHAALEERVRTTEARLASVVAELSAKSSALRDAEARIAQLDSSLTNARRDVSDTFASEKVQLRAQFRAMQAKMDEQARLLAAAEEQGRQALQQSLAQRDDSHARAVEGMQARVKELLAKKEGVIEALQRRVQEAEAEVQRVHQELHHLG